ncbi:MAG: heavy-metal-associated domain-containing protein [Candidatus Tectomicrobia bacterium]|nr:heavy-metal-associated domain-containing protein [Candidatus Tectomicrobia bacterium]
MVQEFIRNGRRTEPLTLQTRPKVRLRSAIPGRERWDVRCLHRRPQLAFAVERSLQGHAGIVDVRANLATGRILVRYDPSVLRDNVKALILAVLDTFLAPRASENGARPTAHPLYRLL